VPLVSLGSEESGAVFLPSIKPMRVGRSGEFRFLLECARQNSETGQAYAEDPSDKD